MTIRAIYRGGVLQPIEPLTLKEGQTIEMTFTPSTQGTPISEDEIVRRIQSCKSIDELLEVTKLLPEDDGGYDVEKALRENRQWSGEAE